MVLTVKRPHIDYERTHDAPDERGIRYRIGLAWKHKDISWLWCELNQTLYHASITPVKLKDGGYFIWGQKTIKGKHR